MKKIISLLIVAFAFLITSCSKIIASSDFVGDGNITTKETVVTTKTEDITLKIRNIDFDDGFIELNIYDYGTPKVEVIVDENIQDTITTIFSSNEIRVEGDKTKEYKAEAFVINIYAITFKKLEIDGGVKIFNTLNSFEEELEVSISGYLTGSLNLEGVLSLNMNIAGSGNFSLDNMSLDNIVVDTSGTSQIIGTGTINKFSSKTSGSSYYYFDEVTIKSASLDVTGTGTFYIDVSDLLDIKASGLIIVEYTGNPVLNTTVAGAQSIKKVG